MVGNQKTNIEASRRSGLPRDRAFRGQQSNCWRMRGTITTLSCCRTRDEQERKGDFLQTRLEAWTKRAERRGIHRASRARSRGHWISRKESYPALLTSRLAGLRSKIAAHYLSRLRRNLESGGSPLPTLRIKKLYCEQRCNSFVVISSIGRCMLYIVIGVLFLLAAPHIDTKQKRWLIDLVMLIT